jgi:TnpA family transposase
MDLRVRAQVAEEKEEMEDFLSSLSSTSIATQDPEEILRQLDVTQEVREATQQYIDRAEDAVA